MGAYNNNDLKELQQFLPSNLSAKLGSYFGRKGAIAFYLKSHKDEVSGKSEIYCFAEPDVDDTAISFGWNDYTSDILVGARWKGWNYDFGYNLYKAMGKSVSGDPTNDLAYAKNIFPDTINIDPYDYENLLPAIEKKLDEFNTIVADCYNKSKVQKASNQILSGANVRDALSGDEEVEPDKKDIERAKGIKDMAAATRMANSIKDPEKFARRRAAVAQICPEYLPAFGVGTVASSAENPLVGKTFDAKDVYEATLKYIDGIENFNIDANVSGLFKVTFIDGNNARLDYKIKLSSPVQRISSYERKSDGYDDLIVENFVNSDISKWAASYSKMIASTIDDYYNDCIKFIIPIVRALINDGVFGEDASIPSKWLDEHKKWGEGAAFTKDSCVFPILTINGKLEIPFNDILKDPKNFYKNLV